MRMIAICERLIGHSNRTAGAFGDILAGHLDMDAAAKAALRPVYGEKATDFRQYPFKWTGFVSARTTR